MILTILIATHFFADFTLQSNSCAQKKTKLFRYLLLHSLIYGITMILSLFLFISPKNCILPSVIIMISHFILDYIRIRADKAFKKPLFHLLSFVFDQLMHIGVICILVYTMALELHQSAFLRLLTSRFTISTCETCSRYVMLFIILFEPASVFVRKLSQYVSNVPNSEELPVEMPAGRIIGKLERVVIAILVLCNQIGAIGFVLTAKSIARYRQLEDQAFAEKYLIGTLSSTAIALSLALLLK